MCVYVFQYVYCTGQEMLIFCDIRRRARDNGCHLLHLSLKLSGSADKIIHLKVNKKIDLTILLSYVHFQRKKNNIILLMYG